ncbi:MAG: S66 peptidase family protein [Streptosporangiales bacterium]
MAGTRTRPPRLREGDRVAVVAPSGPVEAAALDAGCAWLRGLGLDVVVGEHAYARDRYVAGDDEGRAADLQRAWCDPGVRGVICARGGYGCGLLLPLLDWDRLAAAEPKLLHGSSDITALHAAFARRLGLVTMFGPMVAGALIAGATPDPESRDAASAAWFSSEPVALRGKALRGGCAGGPVVGGNLSLLAAAAGTPYAGPPARGAIAVLEDVGEAPYRVDRMLTQLLQAGWFDGVAGIVLGDWTDCGDVAGTLAERLGSLGVTVLDGVHVGHGRPQLTVPLGIEADLDADAGTLTFREPALA